MFVRLETPSRKRLAEFLLAAKRSRGIHRSWVHPPSTQEAYLRYLAGLTGERNLGFLLILKSNDIGGVVNISEIARGGFKSGYLGYYAFSPYEGAGVIARGLSRVIRRAFSRERLHRLEANIQPENQRSIALVKRLGFRREGFSPKYLKIVGKWRDHERWAITKEEWRMPST